MAYVPLQPQDEERDRIVGVALAALLVRMNTGARRDGWVHMRVERLSLLDVKTVRREMKIDFTYPTALGPVAHMLRLQAPALLPMALFTKGARLAGFSVLDEEARQLPVLSRQESGVQAATCLVGLARTVAALTRQTLSAEAVEAFTLLALLPLPDAWSLFERMRLRAAQGARSLAEANEKLGPISSVVDRIAQSSELVESIDSGLASQEALLWTLLSDPTLNTLARGLARQFVLLAPLDDARLHERRLLTYGYDDMYRTPAGLSAVGRIERTVRESFGWRTSQYDLEVPGIARAQRYQAEIIAPPTLEIVYAELRAIRPRLGAVQPVVSSFGAPSRTRFGAPSRARAPVPRALTAAFGALLSSPVPLGARGYRAPATRAVLAAAAALRPPKLAPAPTPMLRTSAPVPDSLVALQFEPGVEMPPGAQGLAVVGFQASRIGLVRGAPVLGALIVLLLFVGRGHLASIRDDGSAAALLLAVPTLFAAAVARPGEHALATRLLLGTRLLVMLAGLATFIAAAALVGGWSQVTQRAIWDWAAWIALGATVLLIFGLLISVYRSSRGSRESLLS